MADREVLDVKTPPHSVEAEQSVLGGLMLDATAWERVSETVTEPDFYREDHRLIYKAIAALTADSQAIDAVTVFEQLEREGLADRCGGLAYLAELVRNTPSAANIIQYGTIVRERALLREMIQVAHEVADSAYFPKGKRSADLLDQAEAKMLAIAEKRARSESGPKLIDGAMLLSIINKLDAMRHTGGLTGITTGYKRLDEMTSGMQKGDLLIVAARPSMGKTTFTMNLAETVMMTQDKPVLVFSLEMPAEQIMLRMFASMSRVEFGRIRSGLLDSIGDWERLNAAVLQIKSRNNLYIDDSGGLSPNELRSRARRVFRERGGLSLIIIDYLQLMRGDGNADNRTNEVSEISRALKALAKELSVPVIALSQLNRSLEQRDNKRPIMADLRESGAIEQDADVILFIHREEVYERRKNKNEGGAEEGDFVPQSKGQAEIIIGKQRNGPIGTVMLKFEGQYSRFSDSDELAPEDQY